MSFGSAGADKPDRKTKGREGRLATFHLPAD